MKPLTTLTGKSSFFRVKAGQIGLLVLIILGIGSLAGYTIYSATPHQVEKLSILSESNDAASLAYSQRESFNLALILEDWVRGEIKIREVEISRALLGQRLQVKLADGSTTYSVMSDKYRKMLSEIDKFIISNASTSVIDRAKQFATLRVTYANFLTETRRMSKTIQLESLRQVNKVVKNRIRSEYFQSGILIFVIGLGLFFLIWIIRDLSNAFRDAKSILESEQDKLNLANRLLERSRSMDQFQSKIGEINFTEVKSLEFPSLFEAELHDALQINNFSIKPSGDSFELSTLDDALLETSERNLIKTRFYEVMKQHDSRYRLFFEADFRANHDLQTGFLNERGLETQLANQTILPTDQFAAIFIDIDRFHRINDSMGFDYGDSVMREVGLRLRKLTSPKDVIARLNSDEFLVITPITDSDSARFRALALQSDLGFTTQNNQVELHLTFTVGLVIYRPLEVPPSLLLRHGALALNLANRQIRSGFATYSRDQGQEYVESLADEYAIREGIRLNQFELYFQPVIELSTNTVIGGEALLRWNRPGFGVVGPNEFLPKVREHELDIELGDWVIENALRFRVNARLFQTEFNLQSFRVGINVEASQLKRTDFADKLINSIHRLNIQSEDVSVEVTEHSLTEGDASLQQLQKLKTFGFVIAIDDFGTGYSNLSQVHNLPVSVLKIDKSFLIPTAGRLIDKQLIMDIKQLSQNLGLRLVAEGVESQEVEDFLLESGITRVQGFHYSPPLSEVNFWSWVRDFQRNK